MSIISLSSFFSTRVGIEIPMLDKILCTTRWFLYSNLSELKSVQTKLSEPLDILKNKRYFNYPPYGLGLLRKSLVEKGYDVKILDLNFELLALANKVSKITNKKMNIINQWKDIYYY